MYKLGSIIVSAAFLCGISAVAIAAPPTTPVRGTIESVSNHTLTVKTYGGKTEHLHLNGKTQFLSVVPASLKDVTSGKFVGIGATGGKHNLKAMELVIFPHSMRGTGEGHYAWNVPSLVAKADRGQGTTGMPAGAPPVQGTMTNGTVTGTTSQTVGPPVQGTMTNGTVTSTNSQSVGPPVQGTMTNGTVTSTNSQSVGPPVQGTMTNGTVTGSASASSGEKLTVSYNNGKHVQITVPANTPVVRFVHASHSVLAPGAKIFALAAKASNGNLTAKLVAVGKNGLMPPM